MLEKFLQIRIFKNFLTPLLEETELFKRSVGDETDVVNKEMYTFLDKGNRSVTLRPTYSWILRAYLNGRFKYI